VILAWQVAKEYLKNQAVQGCMEVSSYTFTNPKEGVTTVEPIEKSFQKCLD